MKKKIQKIEEEIKKNEDSIKNLEKENAGIRQSGIDKENKIRFIDHNDKYITQLYFENSGLKIALNILKGGK